MKNLIIAFVLLASSVQAKSLPELKFNLFDLSSENGSGFIHGVFFPEYFAAHSMAYTSGGESTSNDDKFSAVFWYAAVSIAAVAAVSPEAAVVSLFSAAIEGAGKHFDKAELNATAEGINRDLQDFYATGAISTNLEAMMKTMNEVSHQVFDAEEAAQRLSLVTNQIIF